MELCTDIALDEIAQIRQSVEARSINPRDAKMRLAREVTRMYWGERQAAEAEGAFISQFQKKELPDDIREVSIKRGKQVLTQVLVDTQLAPSASEAKRLIKQGAVRIDGQKVTADRQPTITVDRDMVLQVGKLKFVRLKHT